MIVRTMFLSTIITAITLVNLVVIRVILLLLPAMAVYATILKVAAVAISFSLLFRAPETALFLARVLVKVRLTAVVLPVVRILALIAQMTLHLIVEGAPHSLEVEHVKVIVLVHAVKQID